MTKIYNLADLKPDRSNANKGTQRGRGMVESSLRETGAGRSILVDRDGNVIAGNKTLEAWSDIATDEDVIIVQTDGKKLVVVQRNDLDLSDDTGTARKLAIYDNRASEVGLDWDTTELFASMQNGMDLATFWNEDELKELFTDLEPEQAEPSDAEPQIDRAAELQEIWQVKTGDIWKIGEHRLACGDCRNADTWHRLLQSADVNKVNGVFTSPPYAEQRKEQYGGVPTDEYVEWWDALQANVKANLAGDGSFFVNIKAHCEDGQRVLYCMDLVLAMVRRWGWRFVEELIWHNTAPAPGHWDERFKNGFEPIYQFAFGKTKLHHDNVSQVKNTAWSGDGGMNHSAYGGKAGKGETFDGQVRPSNVVSCAGSGSETLGHAAAFPVALPDFFVRAYSDTGDVWLDPFCGSGTTLVAVQNNNRRGLGIELLPTYCSVILQRMQDAFPSLAIERA
ncbi:MAG TPA: DNA modification methylase [Pseudomonadales bacterium]|nr:DNA modification methylase [Pseudomonadales bacterium]